MSNRITEQDFEKMLNLAVAGVHIRDIADQVGYSFQTVSRHLTARGWDRASLLSYRLNTEGKLKELEQENKILTELLQRAIEGPKHNNIKEATE